MRGMKQVYIGTRKGGKITKHKENVQRKRFVDQRKRFVEQR
ncbi:unnamed protein product [Meloidogyne enterolobii]|uniref:Uncharacterized protein n=1 Tax=Meloidogyne enterolobii TaxID=390850 RepID=A0ACB1AZ13_MELEN